MSKSIRFHAIGDPHIAKRHLNLSMEAINGTIKLLEKRPDVDLVVIMGDILDNHDDAKLTFQRIAIDWINKLVATAEEQEKKNDRKIVIAVLIGNHDRPNNQDCFSDIHPFMGIQDIPNRLYIVNKPKAVSINGTKVLFMPYLPPGKFQEGFNAYLEAVHKIGKWMNIKSIKDFPLIFAHQEFEGAVYGPTCSSKGDKWPKDFPLVISGHIHTRAWLQDNIFYTGSLYPITMAESNDKGVICGEFFPDTKKMEYKTVRVVVSQKNVIHLTADDQDGIREMICLDRENTKYVLECTATERASILEKIGEKKLNIAFDIRVKDPTNINPSLYQSYDEILRNEVQDEEQKKLLEEIMS